MKLRTAVAGVLAAATSSFVLTSSPLTVKAAATTVVARWEFGEKSATHLDSSGNNITATSGNEVINGIVYNGATGIRMPYVANWKTAVHPGRLTRANDNRLNPGSADWAVTVRYRTTRSWGNLIQKGQNGAKGGYFKIELPEGRVTCLFKDANGVQRALRSPEGVKYNNGAWHVIRCERLSTGINLFVDGVRVARSTARVGTVANSVDLTIAGKGNCNQSSISCDYFVGDIDYVTIETAGGATATADQIAPLDPAPQVLPEEVTADQFALAG